jgi:hypothetical protein
MADASPFLKRLQELNAQRPVTKRAAAPARDGAAERRSETLLGLLIGGPKTTAELFSSSGMALAEYTDSLAALTEAGLVLVDTRPEGETATLTELGRKATAA